MSGSGFPPTSLRPTRRRQGQARRSAASQRRACLAPSTRAVPAAGRLDAREPLLFVQAAKNKLLSPPARRSIGPAGCTTRGAIQLGGVSGSGRLGDRRPERRRTPCPV